MESLNSAIKIVGGTQTALAEALNRLRPDSAVLGQSAISNWVQRGRVPAERVLDISKVTGFHVTPHDLRPDLYPNPSDGLPSEVITSESFIRSLRAKPNGR